MTARIKISDIHNLPSAYAMELYEAGHVAGDVLLVPMRDALELRRRHNPSKPTKIRGLGDLVHKIALPIAKALKLSCVDKKGQLKPESQCAKRREELNKAMPFNTPKK